MSGTTNVGQEFEFRLLQFLEKEKKLTVEEKQARDNAIKISRIRDYLEQNGEIVLPVSPNENLKGETGQKTESGR